MEKTTFILEQKSFLAILSAMQPICAKRTPMDVTGTILFQLGHHELLLKGTDLEISLQATCLVRESSAKEAISFLVPGRRIFEIVRELESDIACSISDGKLSLNSGEVNLALNVRSADDFPPFPERIENLMQLETSHLLEMLSKVSFLVPQNNANPSLNGLYIELSSQEMRMTATDGHCLAQVRSTRCTLEEERSWLVPRKAICEIKRLLEGCDNGTVFLGVCGNQLVFSTTVFNFFTKVLTDSFPQYEEILAHDNFLPASLDRATFSKSLRRSACLLSGQFIATTFSFSKDSVKVAIENKEVGTLREDIPMLNYSGEPIQTRFYAPYLLSGLQVLADDQVECFLKEPSKPIIFKSVSNDLHMLYLVMPVAPSSSV